MSTRVVAVVVGSTPCTPHVNSVALVGARAALHGRHSAGSATGRALSSMIAVSSRLGTEGQAEMVP